MDAIRVFGLTRLDSLDLKKRFPDAMITFEPTTSEDPDHGELATVALVVVTMAGLQALALWLTRSGNKDHIERTVEIVKPDGTRRKEKLVIDRSKTKSDASVVKALAKLTAFDLDKLA